MTADQVDFVSSVVTGIGAVVVGLLLLVFLVGFLVAWWRR